MSELEVRGARLHYQVHGDIGPWVVLVHGGLAHSGSWADQLPVLSASHRVVTFDIRGYGHSVATDGRFGIPAATDDLEALLGHLGIESAAVVGFSMGGFIAQELALRAPELVQSLVLVSTAARVHDDAAAAFRERARVIERDGLDAELEEHVPRAFSIAFRTAHPDELRHYAEEVARNDPIVVAATFRALAEFDAHERLHGLAVPTLIVAGAEDAALGADAARELADTIADATVEVLPDVGHTLHLEEPDRFAQLVIDFVDAAGLDAAPRGASDEASVGPRSQCS